VLTTFTTNLAEALREDVAELEPLHRPDASASRECSRRARMRWPRR